MPDQAEQKKEVPRTGRWHGLGTLSTRVIALSSMMTVAILGIAFALTYLPAQNILEEETSHVVDAELRGLIDSFNEGGEAVLVSAISQRAGRGADAVYYMDGDGGAAAGNLTRWPSGARLDGSWFRFDLRADGEDIEAGARALPLTQIDQDTGSLHHYRLLVGRDFRAQRRFSATLAASAVVALLAAGLLAIVGGFIINRIVMRRIGDIDATARAIVAKATSSPASRSPSTPCWSESRRWWWSCAR